LEQHVATLTARIHSALTLDAILNNTASEVGQVFGAPRVVVRLAPEAEAALAGSPAPAGGTTAQPANGNGHGPNGQSNAGSA
jgi:hypothetical protein